MATSRQVVLGALGVGALVWWHRSRAGASRPPASLPPQDPSSSDPMIGDSLPAAITTAGKTILGAGETVLREGKAAANDLIKVPKTIFRGGKAAVGGITRFLPGGGGGSTASVADFLRTQTKPRGSKPRVHTSAPAPPRAAGAGRTVSAPRRTSPTASRRRFVDSALPFSVRAPAPADDVDIDPRPPRARDFTTRLVAGKVVPRQPIVGGPVIRKLGRRVRAVRSITPFTPLRRS